MGLGRQDKDLFFASHESCAHARVVREIGVDVPQVHGSSLAWSWLQSNSPHCVSVSVFQVTEPHRKRG